MSDKDGGPAFPFPAFVRERDQWDVYEHQASRGGMSLRDWFAGQALIVAAQSFDSMGEDPSPDRVTRLAYLHADAMLRARTNDGEGNG